MNVRLTLQSALHQTLLYSAVRVRMDLGAGTLLLTHRDRTQTPIEMQQIVDLEIDIEGADP